MEMHSRAQQVLIDLLWFNVVHYSSTFFNLATMFSTLANFLVYFFFNFLETLLWLWLKCNTGVDPGGSKDQWNLPFWQTFTITW